MNLRAKFVNWLKWKVAEKELNELARLKLHIRTVGDWNSHIDVARATAEYIRDPFSYPRQFMGAHGSIEDFRAYLEKLASGEIEKHNALR